MRLRQRAKKAKKELKLAKIREPSSTWEIMKSFEKRTELENVINYKRQFNTYHNDENMLEGKKVTYMELSCGVEKLCVMRNRNGRPLSDEQKSRFTDEAIKSISQHTPVIYERYKDNDKLPDNFHVLYCLYQSVDRTKSKRLVCKQYIYQFKNSKSLFIKRDGQFVKIAE
jgi:hypothetical protein